MRIASGDTGREVAFVAVDATDFTTRETGLSSFTVYRMRDGGTPAAMTTPTITECDSTNMPGVYTLLLDEDTTIGAGNDEEEMVFHVTHAGMAPVTLTVELFRPKYTEGSTLSAADINTECDTAISDASLATSAALATVDSNVDAILVDTGTTLPGTLATLATSSALATVDSNVDAILVDTGTTLPATLSTIEGKIDTVDTVAGGIQTDLDNATDGLGAIKTAVDAIPTASAPSAASIADAVWDESTTGHTTAGTFGEQVKTDIDAILADTNELQTNQGDWATATGFATSAALATVDANVDAILVDTGTTLPASLSTIEGKVDTVDTVADGIQTDLSNGTDGLGAIKTAVDAIPTSNPTAASIADAVWTETLADHSGGAGSTAEALDGATAPTAAAVADAVWDEAISGHLTAGTTGASLNAAGSAGDPWATTLPGSYTGSQAGKILDDILTDTGATIQGQISGLNDLAAADVRTAVGLASANLDTQLATIDGKVDTVDGNVDAILVDTGTTLPGQISGLNDLSAVDVRASLGLAAANLDTQIGAIDSNVDAVLVDTGTTIPGIVAALNDLSAADVRTAVGLASADLDTQLGALPTATENADTLLNRDMSAVSDTNARSPLNALRAIRNKVDTSVAPAVVYKEDDTTQAWTSALTKDAAADNITVSDPA